MAAYSEQKPKPVRPAETGFGQADNGIRRPEVDVSQSYAAPTGTIVFVIAAIVLAVGAYLLYANNNSMVVPSVTQNNITVPAPAASTAAPGTPPAAVAITPDPATPPAAEKAVKPEATKPAQ